MAKVYIGILARNEASRIGNVLSDLARQTLLTDESLIIGICVVANGCTDRTAEVARNALSGATFSRGNLRTSVHNLVQAGKSNAWNYFIHELVPPDTNYVLLLDADIRIPEAEALQRLLNGVALSEQAVVAVGESVKDLSLHGVKTCTEWLIRAGTAKGYDRRSALTGAFYCARYTELAKIWMPIGLSVENGFLRAMLMTRGFSEGENSERLVFVDGARHVFESERSIPGIFRHSVRLAIGTGVNILLFGHLRNLYSEGFDLAQYVRERNAMDPDWLNSLVDREIKRGRYFVMSKGFLLGRWEEFRKLPLYDRIRGLPIFVVGALFDVVLYITANALMRRGRGAGFW